MIHSHGLSLGNLGAGKMRGNSHFVRTVSMLLAATFLVSACATQEFGPDGRPLPRTALQKSIGPCLASIGIGLAVDLLLSNKKRPGAGTAVGAGLCAVILIVNNEEDKKRIRESQLAALEAGQNRTDTYVGQDGQARFIKTSVQAEQAPPQMASYPLPNGDRFVGPCRRSQTTISVADKGNADLDADVYCRTAQGNWIAPATGTSI